MSVTKVESKIHKPWKYNEIIANLIYGRKWVEVIEKEL